MSDFILSCCSTADMSEQFFKDRGINVLLFSYTMDGVTYPDDFGHSIPFDEFYRRIAEGATPTTSQVNVEEYLESFTPYLKEGKDILHVTLSSGFPAPTIRPAWLRRCSWNSSPAGGWRWWIRWARPRATGC